MSRSRSSTKKKGIKARLENFDSGLIRIVVIVLVLGAAGAFAGPKLYREYRKRQIDANLGRAEAALRVKDWQEARSLSRSVLIARPADFGAFRIYHKASAEINDPETYVASVQLFVNPQATTEDKVEAIRVLCKDAPQAVALSAFASLAPELRGDIRFRAAVVPLLLHRGDLGAAEGLLRESPDLLKSSDAKLQLVRVLCGYPTPERVAEARKILADLISTNQPQGLDAMIALGNVQGGLDSGDPLPDLPSWVNSQPDAKTIHHFYAIHPALLKSTGHLELIFQPLVDRFLPVDPGVVGNWLVSHGQVELAIKVLEPFAKTSSSAYIERTRALMKASRFTELEAAIASPPPSVDLVDFEIIKTAIAFRRKDSAAVTAGWERVLKQAAFDQTRNRFLEINQYAALLGGGNFADDAMVAAIRIGWGRIPLYKDITPLLLRLARANRTNDLLAIYRTMLRFEPVNPELINNYTYLAMLHDVLPPAQAVERLTPLAEQHPEILQIKSSLALACLLNHEPQRAIDIVDRNPPDESFPENLRNAIKAGALIELKRNDEGALLVAKVNWSAFFSKEASTLREFLAKLKVRDLVLPEVPASSAPDAPENTTAWRKAVQALEQQRAKDVLPALPSPKMPSDYELKPEKPKAKKEDAPH